MRQNFETYVVSTLFVGVGCIGGVAVHEDVLFNLYLVLTLFRRCGILVCSLGVFVIRGTFVFYPVGMFCFHGIIVFIRFGILYDSCGFWLQERIVKVAEIVKIASIGSREVRVIMPFFYNAQEVSLRLYLLVNPSVNGILGVLCVGMNQL